MSNVGHAGILTSFRTLKDGTVSFTINCQEMTPETAGRLVALNNQFIKFFLTDAGIIEDSMIEELENLTLEKQSKKKPPSQRLRAVLYRYHEQSNTDMDFEQFYEMWMERIMDMIKNKLD